MKTSTIDLLENKNFEDLTPGEKALVLDAMSEDAYRAQRQLIRTALEMAAAEKSKLSANPLTIQLARQKLKDKKKTRGAFIFQHRIPTWMAVAACLLLFLGLQNFYTFTTPGVTTTTVTETIYDTIYTEKIVPEKILLAGDTITRYIYLNSPEVSSAVADNTNNFVAEETSFEHLSFREDPYCNIMSCYEPKKGIPVINDTLLAIIPRGI